MSKNTTTFFIVRHGQTDWNASGKIQGHSDISLNEIGRQQAIDAGKLLRDISFDAAFSSDLVRARETAEYILGGRKIVIQTTKLLRERDFGELEGKEKNLLHPVQKDLELLPHPNTMKYKPYNTYESDEEIISRVIPFLQKIALSHMNKTVFIATHAALMRTLLIHLGFGLYPNMPLGSVKHTGYIKLESDGTDFFVKETYGVDKKI